MRMIGCCLIVAISTIGCITTPIGLSEATVPLPANVEALGSTTDAVTGSSWNMMVYFIAPIPIPSTDDPAGAARDSAIEKAREKYGLSEQDRIELREVKLEQTIIIIPVGITFVFYWTTVKAQPVRVPVAQSTPVEKELPWPAYV